MEYPAKEHIGLVTTKFFIFTVTYEVFRAETIVNFVSPDKRGRLFLPFISLRGFSFAGRAGLARRRGGPVPKQKGSRRTDGPGEGVIRATLIRRLSGHLP